MGGYRFISLSSSEEKEIKKLQSKGCSAQEYRRLESLMMSSRGHDISTISGVFGIQPDTVGKWFDRWENEGSAGIMNLPKSGRPRIFSATEEKKLRTLP